MFALFFALALISGIAFIAGIICPSKFVFWTKNKARKNSLLYLAAAFIFLVFTIVFAPPVESKPVATPSSARVSSKPSSENLERQKIDLSLENTAYDASKEMESQKSGKLSGFLDSCDISYDSIATRINATLNLTDKDFKLTVSDTTQARNAVSQAVVNAAKKNDVFNDLPPLEVTVNVNGEKNDTYVFTSDDGWDKEVHANAS